MSISQGADTILVDLSVEPGYNLTGVKLWTKDTYKDTTRAIDLLPLAPEIIGDITFSILANALDGITVFSGIFFIEFTETEEIGGPTAITQTQMGVVANYISYHECMMDRALEVEVKNCKIQEPNCSKKNNVFFINTLLDSLYTATLFSLHNEALKMIGTLDELCVNCSNCPDLGDALLLAGLGFSTVNNQIIQI